MVGSKRSGYSLGLIAAGILFAPSAMGQDTDNLALPARKEAVVDKVSDSTQSGALERLSKASRSGNIYGVKKVDPPKQDQKSASQTSEVAPSSTERPSNSVKSKSETGAGTQKPVKVTANKPEKTVKNSKITVSPEKKAESINGEVPRDQEFTDRKVSKSEDPPDVKSQDADDAIIENLRPGSVIKADSETIVPDDAQPEVASVLPSSDRIADAQVMPPAPPMAPTAAFVPNAYLSQTPEKRGILSRIFSRKQTERPMTAMRQSSFSSDYATRGNAILPTVLDGNGFNGKDLPIGGEDPFRLASLPSSFRPTDLVQLPVGSCHYGNQLYLRREAAVSLCQMITDASCQGLTIRVVSAYRDYGHQLRLYTQAVSRRGENQQMVARPGKSEHHLGTTVDLTNNEQHCLKRSFGDTREGRWLAANAHKYGWKMTVMSGNGRRSHNDEPWHLRYLGGAVNAPSRNYAVAQTNSRPQASGIGSKVKRLFGLNR